MIAETALKKLAKYNGHKGTCWTHPSNLERLNEVRELIYSRGDWVGTVDWYLACIKGACFALPYYLETIRAGWVCGGAATVATAYVSPSSKREVEELCCSNRAPTCLTFRQREKKVPYNLVSQLRQGSVITLVNEDDRDTGLKITMVVKEPESGRRATREVVLKGIEGVEVSGSMDDLYYAAKPITKGPITLFVDGDPVAEWMGPHENPLFTHYMVSVGSTLYNGRHAAIFAKKRCLPIVELTEEVDIPSLEALQFGYIAKNEIKVPNNYAANIQLMENCLEKADMNLTAGSAGTDVSENFNYSFAG